MAQFVPLKVETAGAEWSNWARKYPPDGSGIPIIYVIRADGMKLYGKSGALNGNDLPLMMQTMLQQSGNIYSDQQIVALETAVETAQKAEAEGDVATAVRSLAVVGKIGTLGELGSHAKSALAADQLTTALTEKGKAALADAEKQLDDPSNADKFAGALAYVEAKRVFGQLPTLKVELAAAARKYDRDQDLREPISQAESLDRARLLTATSRTQQKGIEALQTLAARYPGQAVAELAIADLKAAGETVNVPADEPTSEFRTFTDITGEFKIEAQFLGVEDGSVVLKKKDGETIRVPFERLSLADQEFAKAQP